MSNQTHFSHTTHTARCGRVLRRPTVLQIEPDAKPIDRVIGWVGALCLVGLIVMFIIEKVTS